MKYNRFEGIFLALKKEILNKLPYQKIGVAIWFNQEDLVKLGYHSKISKEDQSVGAVIWEDNVNSVSIKEYRPGSADTDWKCYLKTEMDKSASNRIKAGKYNHYNEGKLRDIVSNDHKMIFHAVVSDNQVKLVEGDLENSLWVYVNFD